MAEILKSEGRFKFFKEEQNNPILIGEPGVGKTAIVEGLAQRIINHEVPSGLKDKVIMQLDLADYWRDLNLEVTLRKD